MQLGREEDGKKECIASHIVRRPLRSLKSYLAGVRNAGNISFGVRGQGPVSS
jgi:hypothetical protein